MPRPSFAAGIAKETEANAFGMLGHALLGAVILDWMRHDPDGRAFGVMLRTMHFSFAAIPVVVTAAVCLFFALALSVGFVVSYGIRAAIGAAIHLASLIGEVNTRSSDPPNDRRTTDADR